MTGRRLAPLLALVGAGVLLGAANLTWLRGRVQADAATGGELAATGVEVVPTVPALALAAGAGAGALLLAGPLARRLLAVLLGGCGAAVLALIGTVLADPRAGLDRVVARRSAVTTVDLDPVEVRWVIGLAVIGGLVLVAAAPLAWRRASASGLARFDRAGSGGSAVGVDARTPVGLGRDIDPDEVPQVWAALDRGEDPTGGETRATRPTAEPSPPSERQGDLPE